MEYWLFFNTTISRWLVNMCYAYRFKKHSKMSEYRIEFDYDHRYRIELEYFMKNFFSKTNKIMLNLTEQANI